MRSQELAVREVAVQSLFAEQQLEALVLFHETRVLHLDLVHFVLHLLSSSTAHVLDLDESDLRFRQLESQTLNDLVLLHHQP